MDFDPFGDRLARDLRNYLSTAFVAQLTGENPDALALEVGRWQARDLAPVYANYLKERQAAYLRMIEDIEKSGYTDPRHQAVLLWNAGLLFELHELLETIWPKAREPEHTALKGWIQAAGAFVHFFRGKPDAARGLAEKARQNLRAGAEALGYLVNLDQLIRDLHDLPDVPTRLKLDVSPSTRVK